MAFVDTTAKQERIKIESKAQLVRILQGAVSDENGASSSYDRIIESIRASSFYSEPLVTETVERLKHIRDEEYDHIGNLVTIISNLDENIASHMEKGSKGD